MFYRWQLDGFRAQSADKEMVILINRIFCPFLLTPLSFCRYEKRRTGQVRLNR
jgi:hypothetical protein